jgi:hypothetical protein
MSINLPTVQPAPDPRIPILTPLLNLLKQRKFVIDLIVLIIFALATAFPALAKYQDILFLVFLAVTGVVLLPMTVEDIVNAWRQPFKPDQAATDVTNALRDELIKWIVSKIPGLGEDQPPKPPDGGELG